VRPNVPQRVALCTHRHDRIRMKSQHDASNDDR
jgi:hypothetical protein